MNVRDLKQNQSNSVNSPYFERRLVTGKPFSEALLFEEHGENMLCTKIVLNVRNNFCTQHVLPGLSLEFSCIELVIQ